MNGITFLNPSFWPWLLALGIPILIHLPPISDDVEVESHVPDPSVSQTEVRETLTPLVLLDGKVIGLAKVVTSVPVVVTEDAGKGGSAAQGAEEPSPFPPPCGDPGMGP